jgi:hypothetical protein
MPRAHLNHWLANITYCNPPICNAILLLKNQNHVPEPLAPALFLLSIHRATYTKQNYRCYSTQTGNTQGAQRIPTFSLLAFLNFLFSMLNRHSLQHIRQFAIGTAALADAREHLA